MTSHPMNTVDKLIDDGICILHEIKSILSTLHLSTHNEETCDEEERIIAIQLLLQYRLACEDDLSLLLKIDHNLLYALGIQPQQSAKMNRERLAYALGNEDLKQILHSLGILTGSLSKIVSRYKNSHASFALKKHGVTTQSFITKELSKLLTRQNHFSERLHKLDLEIEQLLKLQSVGPIYDHLAALEGPISRFHQALMHGLGQAKQLYQHINKPSLLAHHLTSLLEKTEHVLRLMPSLYNTSPTHSIKQFDHQLTSEQLEQRAAVKRLRAFF